MSSKTKTVYKIKWNNLIRISELIIISVLLLSLIFWSISTFIDYSKTNDTIKSLQKDIEITNNVDDANTTVIKPSESVTKFDSYWNYIKLGLIEPDMGKLKRKNTNSIGWLQITGTKVNYPVVQYKDNAFYKKHSFDKSKNSNGWIYLDSKNNATVLDKNNIIYGNKNFLNILLGNLDDVLKKDWATSDDNYIIKYATSNYTTIWQIVSIYKTDKIKFKPLLSEEEFNAFKKNIIEKSTVNVDGEIMDDDTILTITTNGKNNNLVVHAKLLKIKKKL